VWSGGVHSRTSLFFFLRRTVDDDLAPVRRERRRRRRAAAGFGGRFVVRGQTRDVRALRFAEVKVAEVLPVQRVGVDLDQRLFALGRGHRFGEHGHFHHKVVAFFFFGVTPHVHQRVDARLRALPQQASDLPVGIQVERFGAHGAFADGGAVRCLLLRRRHGRVRRAQMKS
jgi:hypothetical protein